MKMVLVAIAPACTIRAVEEEWGRIIREKGEMWLGDSVTDTEIEMADETTTVRVTVVTPPPAPAEEAA
jgi:hypothetical protein